MYTFELQNGTEMPLRVQAIVDGQLMTTVIPPTDARYRFVHGTNRAVHIKSANHTLVVRITSLTNPEAPSKTVLLSAHVANHITFLCKNPFQGACAPLELMMTSQLVEGRGRE